MRNFFSSKPVVTSEPPTPPSPPEPSPSPSPSPPNNKNKKKSLSGLQKQVLGVYRSLLRVGLTKDRENWITHNKQETQTNNTNNSNTKESFYDFLIYSSENNPLTSTSSSTTGLTMSSTTTQMLRKKFRQQATSYNKRDYDRIEYGIRQGEKYIKLLQMKGVSGASLS